ncbi:MAG TPA: potassium-transporting ATPase subunit KdpB [bacterium]|nr:potassium-transporting ATPase subunit KdpB [bacterium]HQG45112.1 potassium-transporting ATPase subunit KdpB [bacterium]HQJ63043.1 potassium-transporting ATPase subunit KdpB [bacterium]
MHRNSVSGKLLTRDIFFRALIDTMRKFDPRWQLKNPVIFIVLLGALTTTVLLLQKGGWNGFNVQICCWLWFTVLFANFAEALAEGRGKAQAASLRRNRSETRARLIQNGQEEWVAADALNAGDVVQCRAGEIIPSDGEVIEGIATVDESAVTGESAPVIRESGGDRSAVTGGTKVLSDAIMVRITAVRGQTFLDRMISLIEGARRQKTPNEIALSILLTVLSLIFLLVTVSLYFFGAYSLTGSGATGAPLLSLPVLIALLVCLIPTTIGGLLSAIGISGMDRMLRHNVIATSGRAVEAAGDIDVLLLDKTGTITLGNRMAADLIPVPGLEKRRLAEAAYLASIADETPEGRSIVVLAKNEYDLRMGGTPHDSYHFIPFTAQSRMSGIDIPLSANRIRKIRKGAVPAVEDFILEQKGTFPEAVHIAGNAIAAQGGTPLAVAEDNQVLGLVFLKDVVKGGINERFAQMRRMGISTIMITGDNVLTAVAIAVEAGVDDFIANARPEDKLRAIRVMQSQGHRLAMIGDGTNDAPALAQADVGVAMNSGTQAAREAGNMVDLDSNPTKLLDIVEIGKQLLMTRGALTTFSITNDVAKYFAILPALFGTLYAGVSSRGPLAALDLMRLHSPASAILSAVIFNALIIIALVPLALRGVTVKPAPASETLKRNLLLYGLGGLLIPFIGIKLIDLLLAALRLI